MLDEARGGIALTPLRTGRPGPPPAKLETCVKNCVKARRICTRHFPK